MDRTNLRSANLVAVGWEPNENDELNGTLEVEFRRGVVYQYTDIPKHTYEGLLYAQSVGSYFKSNIADHYDGQRIE